MDAAPTVRLLLAAQSGQLEKPGVIQVAARSFFGRSLGLTRNRSSRNPACCQSRVRNRRRETRRASSRGRETVSAASVGLENARARCPGRLPEGAAKAWAKPKARRPWETSRGIAQEHFPGPSANHFQIPSKNESGNLFVRSAKDGKYRPNTTGLVRSRQVAFR